MFSVLPIILETIDSIDNTYEALITRPQLESDYDVLTETDQRKVVINQKSLSIKNQKRSKNEFQKRINPKPSSTTVCDGSLPS